LNRYASGGGGDCERGIVHNAVGSIRRREEPHQKTPFWIEQGGGVEGLIAAVAATGHEHAAVKEAGGDRTRSAQSGHAVRSALPRQIL
jgi:hypothetical protein